MKSDPKIWPARLHHLSICSEDPEQMVEWYKKALIMEDVTLEDGTTWLKGAQRNFIISNGERKDRLTMLPFTLRIKNIWKCI